MAHKKGQGSSKNGRDTIGKRLGIKRFDGQIVTEGTIIVRQRGTTVKPGKNAGLGDDYTIYALINGVVRFSKNRFGKFVNIDVPVAKN